MNSVTHGKTPAVKVKVKPEIKKVPFIPKQVRLPNGDIVVSVPSVSSK